MKINLVGSKPVKLKRASALSNAVQPAVITVKFDYQTDAINLSVDRLLACTRPDIIHTPPPLIAQRFRSMH